MNLSYPVCAALLLCSTSAGAGVMIVQKTTSPDGSGGTAVKTETILLEGSRQRSGDDLNGSIIDLDKATVTMWDAASKMVVEYSLKQSDGPGGMVAAGMASFWNMKFTPTGKTRQVAAINCSEYTATGKLMGDMTMTTCVAKDAPGAAEYRKFHQRLAEIVGHQSAGSSFPEGVMLHSTTVVQSMMSGIPPDVLKADAARRAEADA
jgi:hypothetical protein